MKYIALSPIRFTNKEIKAGDTFTPKSEDAIRPLIDNGKVRPLKDIMTEKYRELCRWLKSYPVSADEIKETLPDRYQAIQDAITDMDTCFEAEDLQGFGEAVEKVKALYLQAVAILSPGKVAIKIYSEILQAYLWVVNTDEDMRSLRSKGISEAIYTTDEVEKLKGIDKESLKAIHEVKEIFLDGSVEEVKNRKNNGL